MYIDPGSGSMFFQMLAATAIGTLFTLRKSIANLYARLRARSGSGSNQHD